MQRRRPLPATGLLVLAASGLLLSGCAGATGSSAAPSSAPTGTPAASAAALTECQQQWGDVAQSVYGLDQGTDPSDLTSRWVSVIATIGYYRTSNDSTDCQARIEAQVRAITALRAFNAQVRAYDMTYQLGRFEASIELYLHDPLPSPTPGPSGRPNRPPAKAAVSAALQVLRTEADPANAELAPAWAQLATVDLDDRAAVDRVVGDLDALAQGSRHWLRAEAAIQVLTAAVIAQEGGPGLLEPTPTADEGPGSPPSDLPTGVPTGVPTESATAGATAPTPSLLPGATPAG